MPATYGNIVTTNRRHRRCPLEPLPSLCAMMQLLAAFFSGAHRYRCRRIHHRLQADRPAGLHGVRLPRRDTENHHRSQQDRIRDEPSVRPSAIGHAILPGHVGHIGRLTRKIGREFGHGCNPPGNQAAQHQFASERESSGDRRSRERPWHPVGMTFDSYGIVRWRVIIHPGDTRHSIYGTADLQNKTLQTSVAFIEISLQAIWAGACAR